DALAPVTGIGEAVMRAAAIHPDLPLCRVMIRQRKMRRPVAKRLTHGDPLGGDRVAAKPYLGLRAFLVNVPALEMFDRPGVHYDQRWVDDRSGVHERAGKCVAARLDHAG